MEQGFDLTQLQRSHHSMSKAGHHAQAAALETLVCGASWPETRRATAGYQTTGQCPRCGKGQETLQHRLYECEANAHIDHPWVHSTEHLCRYALRDLARQESHTFWLRGLVPTSWTALTPHKDTDHGRTTQPKPRSSHRYGM